MFASALKTKRSLYIQHLTFRAIGIDVTSVERTIRKPLQLWLPFLCTVFLLTAMGRYMSTNMQDIDKLAGAFAPFIQLCLSAWKVLMFLFERKSMVKLVRHIYSTTLKATTEELRIITSENSKDKLFASSYYISCIVLGTFGAIMPIVASAVIYMRTGQLHFFETFKASYPFNQNQPLNYIVELGLAAVTTYFAGYCSVSVDSLYSWFVFNIAAQFRVLQLHLKAASLETDPLHMEFAIHKCIKHHQQTIDMAERFHLVFRPIIFAEFLVNCLQLSFLAYQLSRGVAMENIPFLVAFLGAVFVQLMMYCYGGQRLQNEPFNMLRLYEGALLRFFELTAIELWKATLLYSTNTLQLTSVLITTYIYEVFPWHTITTRIKKLLLLPLLRAQKPCKLSGVFFIVDWSLFIWVVRTNASYITMLWTLDENKSK